jgi:glycine betaine catabolism A
MPKFNPARAGESVVFPEMDDFNPRNYIAALLDSRRPGYALPSALFSDERVYAADLEHIFARHWLFVASEAEIPEPGDYKAYQIGAYPVFILRQDDGSIAAFHNTCRHRGSRILQQPSGVVGSKIVCPYHRWGYDQSGKVVDCGPGNDVELARGLKLKPVHLRNLSGLLFVCVGENPPEDFDDLSARVTPYLAKHELTRTKVAKQVDLIEHGNWKLTMENNRECYHCVANHPELTISLYEYGFGYQRTPANEEGMAAFEETVARRTAQWEAMNLPSAEIERLADLVTGFRTQRLPLDRDGESQTLDAKVASKKLLGGFEQADLGGLSFWTQPNSWHHFMSDHIVSF